ncbi:MAG TPA: SCO family protein [Oligoflexus sp.]|uniref:SCO family protein n=1 Tax=Oligoflexus sp. TaxID=1971216 RepID=UPI002D7FE8EB|nr:SCO family protein [Oligoflexus sp.]HET9241269.1 SCO family protein [Oligoflexus sp.]
MQPGRSTDISLKALFVAGSLSLLALWWAWPRVQPNQKLRAEISQLVQFDPRSLPDFKLSGMKKPLTSMNLKGTWTLLYFGYSRCPDDCPTTLGALASVYRQMEALDQTHSLRLVMVSVAADDDAQRIQDFAASFHPRFEGYAGSWEEREKLFLFFDASVDMAPEQGPDQYFHAPNLFLVDPEAHHVATWNRLPEHETLHQELCSFINCP